MCSCPPFDRNSLGQATKLATWNVGGSENRRGGRQRVFLSLGPSGVCGWPCCLKDGTGPHALCLLVKWCLAALHVRQLYCRLGRAPHFFSSSLLSLVRSDGGRTHSRHVYVQSRYHQVHANHARLGVAVISNNLSRSCCCCIKKVVGFTDRSKR